MAVKMVRLGAGAKTGCKARGQQGTCPGPDFEAFRQ